MRRLLLEERYLLRCKHKTLLVQYNHMHSRSLILSVVVLLLTEGGNAVVRK